jgi:hypothetical protein
MARDFYIDTDSRQFVEGLTNAAVKIQGPYFKGDTETLNLYFLQRTGVIGTPYSYSDKSSSTAKVSWGTLGQSSLLSVTGFSALSTSVTATISTVQNGTSTQNDIQSLNLSKIPSSGYIQISFPSVTLTTSKYFLGNIELDADYQLNNLTPATFVGITGGYTRLIVGGTYYLSQGDSSRSIAVRTVRGTSVEESASYLCTFDQSPYTTKVVELSNGVFNVNAIPSGEIGDEIKFLPDCSATISGITAGTTYYIVSKSPFKISATSGGSALTSINPIRGISASFATKAEHTESLSYPISAVDLTNQICALKNVGVGNFEATKTSDTDFLLEFKGIRGNQDIATMTALSTFASAPGFTATVGITSAAITTLLSGTTSAPVTLEVELTSGGNKLTAAQGDATLAVPISH